MMTVDDYATKIEKVLGAEPTELQKDHVRDLIRDSWREVRQLIKGRLEKKPRSQHDGVDTITLEDALSAVDGK